MTECPDYSNAGACRNAKCRLPHVDRAGELRKAAARQAKKDGESGDGEGGDVSDLSSGEEEFQGIDSDDADSDDLDEDVRMSDSGGQGREMSQQEDFISL